MALAYLWRSVTRNPRPQPLPEAAPFPIADHPSQVQQVRSQKLLDFITDPYGVGRKRRLP